MGHPPRRQFAELLPALKGFARWLPIALAVGATTGAAVTLFMWGLDFVTAYRELHPLIILGLPVAAAAVAWFYARYGATVEAGNNMILEEIHEPRKVVPARLGPLILLSTWTMHLFGASVGREGTAVQMGGSLADQLTWILRLPSTDRRRLLMAGMSAGFAAVFGTPLAGAIFGLEVLAIGRLEYEGLLSCFIAAWAGNAFAHFLGIHHAAYPLVTVLHPTWVGTAWAVATGAAFGLTGSGFAWATHAVSDVLRRTLRQTWLRPFVAGVVVVALAAVLQSTRYLGLGVEVIQESFTHALPLRDSLLKALFSVISLGSGMKGGEVTPLFFIGATLGSALSAYLPLATGVLAALGFVAVFAGAANTPLACTLMGIELFGSGASLYLGLACVASYVFSGHAGIYRAQKIGRPKLGV